jgi:hypothetical protein
VAEISRGEVDAFYLHLAEGQADNQRSKNQFGWLADDYQGLTGATVLIHGTALTRQLGKVKDDGADCCALVARLQQHKHLHRRPWSRSHTPARGQRTRRG